MAQSNIKAVFIGGADRSGTTMLGAALGNAPTAITTPESQFVYEVYKISKREQFSVDETWHALTSHIRFKFWDVSVPPKPDVGDSLNDNAFAAMVIAMVEHYAGEKCASKSPQFWIDHTPLNTRNVALILHLFPNAKIVHLLRDGRAIAASFQNLHWGPQSVYATARWWPARISHGLAAQLRYGPEVVHQFRYEDVITRPYETLPRVCNFVGIEFTEEMALGFGDFEVPEFSKEQHALVGKAFDASRIDAWKKSLTPRQIEIFEAETFELLHSFGYESMFPAGPKPIRIREKLRSAVVEAIANTYYFFRTLVSDKFG